MNFEIQKNKIIIQGKEDFCPKHILECGQIFSYKEDGDKYIVYSANKMAMVYSSETGYIIETKNPEYFVRFFDLETDYAKIKNQLKTNHKFLENAINFGQGIRILNQDIFETIISFIVSANNNIKRIQKILFSIREKFGKNMGEYFSFPTIHELEKATVEDFKQMGAGYRAEYLYKVVRQLKNENLADWEKLPTNNLSLKLLSLMGVGQKVADCIMLFAFSRKDVFPVDTWIEKVYCTYFTKEQNRKKIRQALLSTFNNLSGYAQQYLFYSQRSNNSN